MKRLKLLGALLLTGLAGGALISAPAAAQVTASDVEVMLAIDTSGSMRHAIDDAQTAANEFVAAMPADVPIGIETFADDVTVLTGPTTDRALLTDRINAISVPVQTRFTKLYDGLVTASQEFTPTARHKALIVLSDGKDDGSTATLADAGAAVHDEQVEAIILPTKDTDTESVKAFATVTPAEDEAAVSAAFARVADLLTTTVIEPPATTAPAVTATTAAPTSTAAPTTTPAPTTTSAASTTVYSRPPAPPTAGSASATSVSSSWLWVGAGGFFVGLFIVGSLLFPRQRVSKARLGITKTRSVSDMGKRTISAVDEVLERHGKRSDVATALSVAHISAQPGAFVGTVALVALMAGLFGLLIGGPILALVVALAICLGVRFYVRRNKAKRQAAFADQLPDVLQLVTTALRSGYGITQALESVAEEAEEPARSEFAHVLVEARLGRDLSESLHTLARRMESKDVEWVVSAIDINRDTGGNLSEILNTVADTIRERQRMARHVRTLTAEGRFSAQVLIALPILMAIFQWRVAPDKFALLTHGIGVVFLTIAVIFMVFGTIWLRRLVKTIAL